MAVDMVVWGLLINVESTCVIMCMQLLLVDKKITNARDLINVLEDAIRGGYPIVLIAEDIEQEALATLVVNKLRGALKIAALKAPGFGERKSQYLDDIAILTGGFSPSLSSSLTTSSPPPLFPQTKKGGKTSHPFFSFSSFGCVSVSHYPMIFCLLLHVHIRLRI